mgnify:CR=1 FL=1
MQLGYIVMQQNRRSDIELFQVRALIQGQYATGKESKLKNLIQIGFLLWRYVGKGAHNFYRIKNGDIHNTHLLFRIFWILSQ